MLENAKSSSMVVVVAMLTTSKLLPHARVSALRPAFFQRKPVHAGPTLYAIILIKWLENAKHSSMVDARAMRTTLKLSGHAMKNVSSREKGKDRL